MYNDDYVEAHHPVVEVVRSPSPVPVLEGPQNYENTEPRTPMRDDDFQEIEILRDDQQNTMPETIHSPIVTPSATRDDLSASPSQTFRSASAPITELYTPSVFSAENTARDYTVLSDVPEVQSEKENVSYTFYAHISPWVFQSFPPV